MNIATIWGLYIKYARLAGARKYVRAKRDRARCSSKAQHLCNKFSFNARQLT